MRNAIFFGRVSQILNITEFPIALSEGSVFSPKSKIPVLLILSACFKEFASVFPLESFISSNQDFSLAIASF